MEDLLLRELKAFSVREEAVRLGGPDANFRADYDSFLMSKVIPVVGKLDTGRLVKLLELVRVNGGDSESQVRRLALETLAVAVPASPPEKPISICNVLWESIESDNEVNGLTAMRTFQHVFKAGTSVMMDGELSSRLNRFMHCIRSLFLQSAVRRIEENRGVEILKEIPSLVHLIVQIFPGASDSYLGALLGDMVSLLGESRSDLADLQVKMITVIAFIGRGSNRNETLRSYDAQIAKACIGLLRSIPADVTLRRELLLSLRSCFHSPDLVVAFVPLIDELFDESIIVGVGRSGYDLLRPVVVSALADFANATKDKIPLDRLRRVLGYFCGAMADGELPVSCQFTSARIILNIIDHVFNKSASRSRKIGGPTQPPDGSDILREVLRAVTEKFTSLVLFVPKVIALVSESLKVESLCKNAPVIPIDASEILLRLVGKAAPAGVPLADMLIEGVREVRSLIRTLLLSAKMIVHCLTHRVTTRVLTKADMGLLESLLEDGLKVVHLFACAAGYVQSAGFDMSTGHSSANGGGRFATPLELAVACSIQEERELVEQISGVLSVVPSVYLTDLLSKRISWLIDSIQVNSQLMALCNGLVQTPSSMAVLCEVLYGYLSVKSEELLVGPSATEHQTRHYVVDAELDPESSQLKSNPHSLLGQSSACTYFIADGEAIDGPLLVTHVMPSLHVQLRQYRDIVTVYGLRESPVKIDPRDIVVTIGKTLARQAMSSGNMVIMEPLVRPFCVEISVACIRIAKTYPESAFHAAGILRYLYRLMGAGTKTTLTTRELGELVPYMVDQCRALARHWINSPVLHALWLEIAITVPVRLKSLVSHFEVLMGAVIDALSVDGQSAGETIAVALSVLEAWVDGLTPDFLLPLIPGHGVKSLPETLMSLTHAPGDQVVHSSLSGNNALRAAKILGKLGIKAKFCMDSYNVTGREVQSSSDLLSTSNLVLLDDQTVVEVDLKSGLQFALSLLRKHALTAESIPVSLQDPPVDSNEVPVIPEQELMDSLNLIVTSLTRHRGNEPALRTLCSGLIFAAASSSKLVADRALTIIADLGFDDENVDFPLIVQSAIQEIRGGHSDRICRVCCDIISQFVAHVPAKSTQLIAVTNRLAERLLSLHWTEVIGACRGLQALAESDKSHTVFMESGLVVLERCMHAFSEAEGTRVRVPCTQSQQALLGLTESVIRSLVGSNTCTAAGQDAQVQYLNSKQFKASSLVRSITERCVELFVSNSPCSGVSDSVLNQLARIINVSMASLMCWVDGDMRTVLSGISGERSCPVFRVTCFVLAMRPAPVLSSPVAGDQLHKALISSINRTIEWLESEDELRILYDQQIANVQQQSFALQRAVFKRRIVEKSDIEGQHLKWIEAVRLLKLTLLHPQLGASGISTTCPSTISSDGTSWALSDRISVVLARCLFSFDFELVSAVLHAIACTRIVINEKVWGQCLLPLAREVSSRLPSSVCEIQGLGRLLQLTPLNADEARAELAERLLERLHTYLTAMRERTFTPPMVSQQSFAPSWRALVGQDSVVILAAVTLECFGSLQSERSPLVERLLVVAAQLDAALPSTFGSGQLASPFLLPLIPSLCSDPERTADQLLTKMELHKVFGLVAEVVSLRPCLGLRKALQDKCHHMSLMDTGILMMRTAAASLISVLARHDPSYLWIQYCSVLMKASMGLPRSLSLIESLVRNWETSLASLTSVVGGRSVSTLGPGGILGPSDSSNAINSYEGRIIAWSIMQFLRAPVMASPGIVTDLDSHLNIRVRLLIRLATSLSFKYLIEVSPIQDWFVNEAPSLTTAAEKREIIAKTVEAFSDGAVGLGCKYVLVRYLLIPQVMKATPEVLDEELMGRLCVGLLNPSMHVTDMDESVRVEIIRLLIELLKRVPGRLLNSELVSAYLDSCLDRPNNCALKQISLLAFALAVDARVVERPKPIQILLPFELREIWRDFVGISSEITRKYVSELISENPLMLSEIKSKLIRASGNDVHVWRWFASIASGLDINVFADSLAHVLKRGQSLSTTEARVAVLDVATLLAPSELLSHFFMRHAIIGPEPNHQTVSSVSPTLLSQFMDKCLTGIEVSGTAQLADVSEIRLPNASAQQNEVVRHAKQLIAQGRMLNVLVKKFGSQVSPGHLAHYIGLAMVSTDKSVATVLGLVASTIAAKTELGDIGSIIKESDKIVWKQLLLGVQAGLNVASNRTSEGRFRVHPLNPNSPSFLVAPYTAICVLIGLLRGLASRKDVAGMNRLLTWFQSSLVKAVCQGSRSLVLGLLPQHLHEYALNRSAAPAADSVPVTPGNVSFAYPGVLQGPDFAVPSLVEIVRVAHLATDLSGTPIEEFRRSVVWLTECLGPFVSLASLNQQTFAHVLGALNFAPSNGVKNGPPNPAGGLASMISVTHLSALMRHCIGIGGRWCLGSSYSVEDSGMDAWILDDVVRPTVKSNDSDSRSLLVLSLSCSLVGSEALLACCDVSPAARLLVDRKSVVDYTCLDHLVAMHVAMDGLGVLSQLSDSSVKKFLGFVPLSGVHCFPGSLLEQGGLWSTKSGPGGLFALSSELVAQVIQGMKDFSKFSLTLLPSILVGCVSSDRLVRSTFNQLLVQMTSYMSVSQRLEFILKSCPWTHVSARLFLPVIVEILFASKDDRIESGEEDTVEFAWIDSLISLNRFDPTVSFYLLVDTLRQVIPHNVAVLPLIVPFLSKSFLTKQSLFRLNVPIALLRGFGCSLPPSMLVHSAQHHGGWFEALEILEQMPQEREVEEAIKTILSVLGEKDSVRGLKLMTSNEFRDVEAVTLLAQDRSSEARSVLEQGATVSDPDLWLEATKSLSDWNRLVDAEIADPQLRMEIYSKSNEWSQVSDLMQQHDWSSAKAKLMAGYLALSDSNQTGQDSKQRAFLTDLDQSVNRSLHQLCSEWAHLPPSAEARRDSILLMCQELVEFVEASNLVTDIRSAILGGRPGYPNPKQLLNAWRDRLPDRFDSKETWFELLSLRMGFFKQIQSLCAVDVVASSHISPYLHDYPWSLVKLAANVGDANLSQSLLIKFQQSLSRSTDAFNQELFEALKEQVRLYAPNQSSDSSEIRMALNVLNSCAISNSNSQQAAEISWLQGRMLKRLGQSDSAKSALLFAVNTYPMIAKAWLDLGDVLFESFQDRSLEEREECLMAYMLGLALRPNRASRLVPRMLRLVKSGCRSLMDKCKESQPSSVWIFWVPTLILSLSDPDLRDTAKALLLKICLTFPQSVYWHIQPLLAGESAMEIRAVAEEILNAMRTAKTAPLFHDLDGCRDGLVSLAEQFVKPVSGIIAAAHALEDVRFKRGTVQEIKSRYPSVKCDISEQSLLKHIKSERSKLSSNEERDDLFIGSRWDMTGLVEVPCSYTRFGSVPSGSSMESMSGVRIAAVSNAFETVILDGTSQVVVPRITFIGTNGLQYAYTLKTGEIELKGLQTVSLCNELLGKYGPSRTRGLRINTLQSVPVSAGLVLEEAPGDVKSFERILIDHTEDVDAVDASVTSFKNAVDSASGRNAERSVFDSFEFPEDLLKRSVEGDSPAELYGASKKFTSSVACVSMVDHLLHVGSTDRALRQIFLAKDGCVFIEPFADRHVPNPQVPFRLTQNVTCLMGERNIAGPLPICMRSVVDCLDHKRGGLVDFLTLFDEPKSAQQLEKRIDDIVGADGHLHFKINALISESRDSKNLAHVQPKQWLPWL